MSAPRTPRDPDEPSAADPAPAPGARRTARGLLAGAFALGLLAHVALFALLQPRLQPWYFSRDVDVQQNAWNPLITDASTYGNLARPLVENGTYTASGVPVTTHMPGTPLLLALSKRTVGHLGLYGGVQVAGLFLGAFAWARVAARRSDPRLVAGAALLFLLQPLVIFAGFTVNSDALFSGCFLGFLALATGDPSGARRAGPAGVLLGAGAWFREVALANAIGAAASLVLRPPRRARAAALLVAGFLLALAPWVARNVLAGVGPVLTTSKTPEIFYICSFGLSRLDVDPFDIDEGGALSLTEVNRRAARRQASAGFGPSRPAPDTWFLREGLRNYVTRPASQARSLIVKAANLVRPPIARRHLAGFLPPPAATAAWVVLALQHALLIGTGLFCAARDRRPETRALRGALAGTIAVSMLIWTEPRYLVPFYLPLTLLALEMIAGRRMRAPVRAE